jgi:hypothetical protein
MNDPESEKHFKFAAALIKIIVLVIALLILVISRYAFIFFSSAMLPTIIAIFFDRNNHKCISATICTFNLIGALPYLKRLWESQYVNQMAKSIIADIDTWIVIYGAAFVGQLLYLSFPLLVAKFYSAKNHVQIAKLMKRRQQLSEEWGIPIEDAGLKKDPLKF